MVQVMLSLWSLFIEFLGSYSRCKVTNGVMPRVLGPTSFYLKIWVNILTIRMLLRSQDEHQNVAVFFIRMLEIHDVLHLGSSWMNVGWISGLAQHVMWDLFEFYPPKSSLSISIQFCWKRWDKVHQICLGLCAGERENSGSATSGPCFKEICLFTAQRSGYLWCKISFALLANFSPTTLFIGWSMRRHEHSDHQNVPFVLTLGWFVRLAFNVINPNSKDITEVQWMQHLGLNSHWNIPSTLMFIVLDEH